MAPPEQVTPVLVHDDCVVSADNADSVTEQYGLPGMPQ